MNRYVVFVPGGQEIVERTYPDNFRLRGCDAWAIGSNDRTCADVCERLGLGGDKSKSGVVFLVEQYYGHYDRALWEKLNAWRSTDV